MSPENADDAAADADDDGRTTVLPPGAVESRNPDKSSLEISSEIRAFLMGDDGTATTTTTTTTPTTAMIGRAASSELRSFFTVWMFVSRLPSPSNVDLHPGYLMRGMCYFPVAGSLLGCATSIVHDFLRDSAGLPPPAAATLSVAFGLCLTGCFHEDGLADTADGMGGWSKSQVLKIMTDSRVGTYGCAALSLFLLLKTQLLGNMEKSRWESSYSSGAGPAILVAQTLSRLSAPYLIRTRDYVAEVGPKSPFYLFMVEAKHIVTWPRVTFATFYCYSVSAALYGPAFAIVLVLAVLVVAHLAGNEGDYLLGGVMGDFLGCTICICEIIVLTLIAARGPIVETCRAIADAFEGGVSQGYFSDPVQRMATLYDNDRIRPLANLLFLMAALKMWCKFVGPPDMYDREVKKDDTGKED
jgi:cobalamin synthase